MGTRGLLFIRCNGRYYVYYNHWDSYPEGLGRAIVELIPTDPQAYLAWLESTRAHYSRLSTHFENDMLCVPPKFCRPLEVISAEERFSRRWSALDDRLEGPPTQTLLLASDGDIFIEWTYTIDLDQELFVVDKAAAFSLRNVPSYPQWYNFLGSDRHRRRILKRNTPSALIGLRAKPVTVESKLLERYKSFKVEVKPPDVLGTSEFINPSRAILLNETISAVCYKYKSLIDGFYLEWTSNSYTFRELAFAILSIAAGEIVFKWSGDLNVRYASQGFYMIPDKEHPDNQQALLPRFLFECHEPGVNPGSAPKQNPFWLGNVLVYLTPRTDLVKVEEAAISAVIDNGLGQGLESFHAMVFSILELVLIQVKKEGNGEVRVKRSALISLLHFDDNTSIYANGPRSRYEQAVTPSETATGNVPKEHNRENELGEGIGAEEADEVDEGDGSDDADGSDGGGDDSDGENGSANPQDIIWFDSHTATQLICFFDATTNQHLAGTKSRIFPNEIMTIIMQHCDHQTSMALSREIYCCRDTFCRKFRLNDDYAIVDQDQQSTDDSTTLALEDLNTGDKMTSRLTFRDLESLFAKKPDHGLHLVIGTTGPNRRSIVDALSFVLDFPLKRSPYASIEEEPEILRDARTSNGIGPEQLFELPDYLSLDTYLEAFKSYILGIFEEEKDYDFSFVFPNAAHWPCLLPHGYRELSIPLPASSGIRTVFKKKPDESPKEWTKTIAYAAQRLEHEIREEDTFRWNYRFKGGLVVVAFHRKVKLFFLANNAADLPPHVTNALSPFTSSAEKDKGLDLSTRLVDLIPGDEPADLDDRESRQKFESWVRLFCHLKDKPDGWDQVMAKLNELAVESATREDTTSAA